MNDRTTAEKLDEILEAHRTDADERVAIQDEGASKVEQWIKDMYPSPERMGKDYRDESPGVHTDRAIIASHARQQADVLNGRPQVEADATGFPIDLVKPASEFISLDLPPREDIIESVLFQIALMMIVGRRGIGKTRLVLAMLNAITRGLPWLAWRVVKALRCLYVDGELPAIDLFGIVRETCGSEPSPLLEIISSEFFYKQEGMQLTLNSVAHQQRFLLLLDALEMAGRRPDVIVFDNLSSMTYGTDENSNSEQDSLLRFLMSLRHRGYTVIVVHHTGNSGEQRGASRREDFLDIVVKLDPPETKSSTGSAKFNLSFSKIRRKLPTPSVLECELSPAETGGLTWGWAAAEREIEIWVQCLRLVQTMSPKTQDEIAQVMNLTKSTVSRHLGIARDRKLLDGLTITPTGLSYLRAIYGGDL